MSALSDAQPPEPFPMSDFDVSTIPGLAARLDPAKAARTAAARDDGRAWTAWRAAAVAPLPAAEDAAAATAEIGGSRARAMASVLEATADDAPLTFEVSLSPPDDRRARRLERLLDDSYASTAAFDRRGLHDGTPRPRRNREHQRRGRGVAASPAASLRRELVSRVVAHLCGISTW